MTALGLLHWLCLAGVQLHARGADLAFKAPPGVMTPVTMSEIRTHKAELLVLLDGSTCRWCRRTINWRNMPGTIALADGTSLHVECREPHHVDRIIQNAAKAVAPLLAADPGEVASRGDLTVIEQAAA